MEAHKNLCAMIPRTLHARVREEQEKSGQTLGAYITHLLTDYYEREDQSMQIKDTRTLAFQVPEELYQRVKEHLARERARMGRKLSQRDFVLGLIEKALEEAGETGQPEGSEPAAQAGGHNPDREEDMGE